PGSVAAPGSSRHYGFAKSFAWWVSFHIRYANVMFNKMMKRFRSSLRIKDDYNVAIETLIEFLKGLGRLRERQAMRNDLTRPGTTGDNQIAQLGVVALIRIATHANGDAFTEE